MELDNLEQFIIDNPRLVSKKETSYPNVYVLKYKKKVFYNNLWNEYLEECRGTLVDKDFNIISYPFTKIYNYSIEDKAPVLLPNTLVDAYRKVNGFMVAVTWYDNDILVSTTGSTDSDYVKMARELIEPNLEKYRNTCKYHANYTFMFECVHRNDPHIILEEEGMYLLGCRTKRVGSKIARPPFLAGTRIDFGANNIEHIRCTINDLKSIVKECKHEGFVAYTLDNKHTFKIKSPYYLTAKWVTRNPKTDKLMTAEFKNKIDEEYYPLLATIRADIEGYTAKSEQERLAWIRNFYE